MNIIRTTAVELMSIPAIAYKQKLAAGGAGVKIYRLDSDATMVVTIDRRTGEGIPYGKHDVSLFPDEAICEALELTEGLPYTSRGKIKITAFGVAEDADDVTEDEEEKVDMVDSDEYHALVGRYTNEKGIINYSLMNKDFIQFASKSKVVGDMVGERKSVDEIVLYVLKSMVSQLSKRKEALSDAEANAFIETLDEIDPRSAFKELKAHLKRMLARSK